VIIPSDKSHFRNRNQPHITSDDEIERVVENADEVYTMAIESSTGSSSKTEWPKSYRDTKRHHTDTQHDRIVVNTAWKRSANPSQHVQNFVQRRNLIGLSP
jgi:hypothetical protein